MDQNENIQDALAQENAEIENSDTAQVQERTEEQETQHAPQNGTSSEEKPIISLQNINIYQRNILILPQISMSVRKGEFVYLIGKTGSGKSSILKTLIAEVPAEGDEAYINGFNLLKLKKREIPKLRKSLGMVFQDYQLLSDMTVLENLMYVLRATRWTDKVAMGNRCEEVLGLVGLATKDFRYPHQLSGGEQQRVCIARALLNKPDILLADEPTGNLDPITSEEIFKIFHDINKSSGTTVVMATHNFGMIDKFTSRTLCIENGKLIDSVL
ncbi:MAG: ATP-binding cassette domain-containing protein [Bacteroidales bacterium]|nr:ATP-binding cassette domain-containing protein [Bacteroidales bacterium]